MAGSVSKDYGAFMKLLMHDTKLMDLMAIAIVDQTNYTKLMTTYFIEAYSSNVVTQTALCRLLIHSAPVSATNNPFVLEDSVVIEVFVPNGTTNGMDRVAGFERRSNQIVDRVIQLFHTKIINYKKIKLAARHELSSGTDNFVRMYIRFTYLKVYP